MNVKLIGITRPVIEGVDSAEALVAYTARVSNPENQNNQETAGKLVRYLIKNNHWSPFEMVHVVMEINTTRDIARQILRHRSFSFQEFSQRYASVHSLGFETREARLQDSKNRQNSVETDDPQLTKSWIDWQNRVIDESKKAYHWALCNGIAKEQARSVLPEGMTHSRLYMSGTLRSWIHYCELRMANGTQKEHMEVAKACWAVLKDNFPNILE